MAYEGKFDALVLWPLSKKLQNWIVDWSTARDFTISKYLDYIVNFMNFILFLGDMVVATKTILDLEEWDLVLAKLHRYDIFINKVSISFSQYSNSGDYSNNFCIFNSF